MSRTLEKTWEQELMEKFEARGEARGILEAHRAIVQTLLEQRFGPLPEALRQRVAAANLESLQKALSRIVTAGSIDELQL